MARSSWYVLFFFFLYLHASLANPRSARCITSFFAFANVSLCNQPGTNDFPPDKPKPPAIPKKKKLHALFRLTFDDEGNCPSLDDVDGLGAFVDGVPDHSTAQYEDVVDAVKAVERRVTREMPGAGSKMIEAVSAVRALLEAQGMSLLKVSRSLLLDVAIH